ncbi:hypothetical protein [Metapseudomonas resinovorans]|uniref:hypothetical protein n=1 Tax=Metapseudomonas resinovorans TaxID=53412 RepID=UPI000490279F|nr:hypothetical protein [Pseudomonas resinovorans]
MSRTPRQEDVSSKVIGVKSVGDMLFKLHWELMHLAIAQKKSARVFSEVTSASFFAFNCAVTAWHIVDWAWAALPRDVKRKICPDGRLDSFRIVLANECPALATCQALANNGKHSGTTNGPGMKVREHLEMRFLPVEEVGAGDPMRTIIHEMYLSNAGVERPAIAVFREAGRFLQARLLQWNLVDDLWSKATFFDDPVHA